MFIMSKVLEICLHRIVGFFYSTSELSTQYILAAAMVVLVVGLIRLAVLLTMRLFSTARLIRQLSVSSYRATISDITGRPDITGYVNVVDDREKVSAFTLGFFRPEIYLTSALINKYDPDSISIVIRHETHHQRRKDPLVHTILDSLAELLWFIPLVRKLVERYKLSSELACDSVVVKDGYDQLDVANVLVSVADGNILSNKVLKPACSSFNDQLELRVRHLLGENPYLLIKTPVTTLIVSFLIISSIFFSSTAAIAVNVDPGGYVSMVREISNVCESGNHGTDFFVKLGIECSHCGPSVLSTDQIEPGTCHGH